MGYSGGPPPPRPHWSFILFLVIVLVGSVAFLVALEVTHGLR